MATSAEGTKPAVKVFVATTVMLTFISFWRAAAIVLSDLASSAYYAGGDAEKVIGKSAPWFILAVMLFSYAVRALYIESSSMFTRGGVYRVVKEAMGGTLAKFSVSALLFDYVLTGPISAVVAGQYLAGFIEDLARYTGHPFSYFPENAFAATFGALVAIYFWRKNTQGIHESSQKAVQIMIITTVMVVILIIWCTITVMRVPIQMPPSPFRPGIVPLNGESLGWLTNTSIPHLARRIGPADVHHRFRGLRSFRPGHERRGDPGPGESGNRAPQAQEPGKNRPGDLRLQPVVHLAGFVFRGDDHSGQRQADLLRKPHRRDRGVPGWT